MPLSNMAAVADAPAFGPESWAPVLILLAIAIVFAGGTLLLSSWVGPSGTGPVKGQPYEAGIPPTGSPHERFNIRFHLIAILFLLFDVEAVLLVPWAVLFGGPAGQHADTVLLVEALGFLAILIVGYVYAWRRGILRFD